MRSLIIVLIGVGLVLSAWRHVAHPGAVAAPGDRLWDVALSIRAAATAGKTVVEIAAPLNTRDPRVLAEHQSSRVAATLSIAGKR